MGSSRARTTVYGCLSLAAFACEMRESVRLALEPPSGAVSGVTTALAGREVRAYAFTASDPSELPVIEGFDEVVPLRVSARFYDRSLREMGLEDGEIPSRDSELEFGTIPHSNAFPEDRVKQIESGSIPESWTLESESPELETFLSPALPFDAEGCMGLDLVGSFVPGPGGRPSRVAAFGSGHALVTFGRGRTEELFELREIDGTWQIDHLDDEHALSRIVAETGELILVSGDERGGYFVGTCTWSEPTKTSTIWWAPSFDASLLPLHHESPGPECPEYTLRVGEDELVIKRYDGSLVWLRSNEGTYVPTELEACPVCQDFIVHGSEVFGLGGDDRVYVYSRDDARRVESLGFDPGDELGALVRLGPEVAAVVRRTFLDNANEIYRRDVSGAWTLHGAVMTPLAARAVPLYDSFVFVVTYGHLRQYSRRHGLCEGESEVSTGVSYGSHLVKLDQRTFLVGGFAETATRAAPSRVAIVRARPSARGG